MLGVLDLHVGRPVDKIDDLEHAPVQMRGDAPFIEARSDLNVLDMDEFGIVGAGLLAIEREALNRAACGVHIHGATSMVGGIR